MNKKYTLVLTYHPPKAHPHRRLNQACSLSGKFVTRDGDLCLRLKARAVVARVKEIHSYKADCDVTVTFPRNCKKYSNKAQLSVNVMDPEEVKVVGKEELPLKSGYS